MSNFTNIKQEINDNIYDNTSNAITASIVRTTLTDMIDAVDENLPTKTSDLVNDSNYAYISYVTSEVERIFSYINQEISKINQHIYEIEFTSSYAMNELHDSI